MPTHRILLLMDRLRRRVRGLVLLAGALGFASCLLAGFLLIGLVDWLVRLPSPMRLASTLALLTGLGYVVLKQVVHPLCAPLRRVTLASRLERRFDSLGNRLSSAVQFLEQPPLGSRQMMDQVVQRADADLAHVDFDEAFSRRVLWRRSVGAIASTTVLLLLTAIVPYWPGIALARLAYPFGSTIWPRTVEIITPTQVTKVPLGESFTAEMRVGRGDRPNLRAFVYLRQGKSPAEVFPMQRSAEGTYKWTFESLTREGQYWFEAGDDSTQHRPGLIQIVQRPALESVVLTVERPAYAPGRYEVRLPAEQGRVEALAGSQVHLTARVNQPVDENEDGSPNAWLLTSQTEKLPLSWSGVDQQELGHTFVLTEPIDFQLLVRGKDGFWNESPAEYQLVPRPDRPPVISIIEPAASLDVTPQSDVELWLSLSDDVGLAGLALQAELVGADQPLPPLDLGDALRAAGPPGGAPAAPTSAAGAEADHRELRYTWKLADWELKPGDSLTCHLEVSDNFGLDGASPHLVRSAPLRLRVLSQAQFTDRLQVEFQLLRNRLRELLTEQEALQYSAEQVRESRQGGQLLTREAAESLSKIAGIQSRLAARTGQLARQFERLVERMKQNRYQDQTALLDTQRMAHELQQLGEGAMTDAARRADQAQQADTATGQAEQLQALAQAQQRSIETLERLLQGLQRWGSFQEMVRKTQEMLDRQQQTTRETAELHRRTMGIPAEALDDADGESAAALSRRQGRLAGEADELMRRMSDMSELTREAEPATSESLAEAQRAAGAGNLSRRLHQAAEAIRRNLAGRAAADQKAAEDILKEMLQRLQNRQSRQLWELARRTEQAEDLVRYFLQQQIELRASTQAAAGDQDPPGRYAELAVEQADLEGNTRQLSKDLLGDLDTARAARVIRAAAGKMSSAADRLRQARGEEAEPFQSAAITELEAALEALTEVRRKAQQELAAQAVLAVRNKLIEIHNAELEIAEEFGELREARRQQDRLRRKQTRQLSRMESAQEELAGEMNALVEQVAQVVVHRWLFESIAADMATAGQRLARRTVDEETAELLDRIVDSLSQAIDSLDLADVQPEDQFAEGAGGAGGGGPARSIKPVPTVAELKLLKQLQADINLRTTELDHKIEKDRPTEKQLRQVLELARRQEEVRDLTKKLFERQN